MGVFGERSEMDLIHRMDKEREKKTEIKIATGGEKDKQEER